VLEETWWDSVELVGCENEGCGGLSFEQELEENDWKCTHCGEPIPKHDYPSNQRYH
jgi:hypothetical protein